ncbi:MAG: hypothetical protein SGJ04_10615 [Bacteroidota bacterium]|nr:hypothetical protein [Bacteroidota bacterium]
MKKLLLSAFITLGISGTALAQTAILPQVGITAFKPTDENGQTTSNNARVGIQAGAYLRLGGTFYVQPGLFYQTTKFERTFDIGQVTLKTGDVKVDAARIDLLFGARVINTDNFKLHAFAGPTYAATLNVDDENNIYTKENFSNGYLSGKVGLGIESGFFSLSAGYDIGLTSVIDENSSLYQITGDIRYGGVYVNLGLVIPLSNQDK